MKIHVENETISPFGYVHKQIKNPLKVPYPRCQPKYLGLVAKKCLWDIIFHKLLLNLVCFAGLFKRWWSGYFTT